MKKDYIKNAVWVGAIILIALLLIGASVAKGSGQAYTEREVIVRQGDTLWTLHSKYGGKSDIRDWVEAVKELNGRDTAMIYWGETIKVWEAVE